MSTMRMGIGKWGMMGMTRRSWEVVMDVWCGGRKEGNSLVK
jgi:hypothetical protein